ncbi:Serine--tRNA ligase, mitochondrial [Varicellaria rhodocarpa]|nr:Serine--tRNA ligase, mitochondrial [Varicellaria rhodocarpa]
MIPGHSSGYASQPLSISQSLRCIYRKSRCRFSTASILSKGLPSIAPRPTPNVKHIVQNLDLHRQNCIDRNYQSLQEQPFAIAKLVEKRKALNFDQGNVNLKKEARELQGTFKVKTKNALNDGTEDVQHVGIGADNDGAHDTLNGAARGERARQIKQELRDLKEKEQEVNATIEELALELPNIMSPETPIGNDPRPISYINIEIPPSEGSKSHVDIGTELDLLDFTSSSTTSGWGWYYLKNAAVLLEQALVQYALHTALKQGFTLVSPPSIVYSHISNACGFRPRDQNGETQVYSLVQQQENKPELCLTGTAEIPFAAMKANTSISLSGLPLRIIGASRCYRAEAGARGVDTKGLYRVHEFTKVEMFAWTKPTLLHATEAFNTMLAIQTSLLTALGLRCRVLEMPSRDLGASAMRKVDIEAYFSSRKKRDEGWGEVTSTSICTDYQTRRLATRMSDRGKEFETDFPYTVNGTAVAIPRIVAAILENGWVEEKEGVEVPECLWPWMGGMQVITKPEVEGR